MFLSNEYPKISPKINNIHETWNDKNIVLFNASNEKGSIQPCLCVMYVSHPLSIINNLQDEE